MHMFKMIDYLIYDKKIRLKRSHILTVRNSLEFSKIFKIYIEFILIKNIKFYFSSVR